MYGRPRFTPLPIGGRGSSRSSSSSVWFGEGQVAEVRHPFLARLRSLLLLEVERLLVVLSIVRPGTRKEVQGAMSICISHADAR